MAEIEWGDDGALWANEQVVWSEQPITPPTDVFQDGVPEATLLYYHVLLKVETKPPLRLTTFWAKDIVIDGETYLGGLSHFNFGITSVGVGSAGRAESTTITAQLGDDATDLRRVLMGRLGGLFASIDLIYSTDGKRWLLVPNRIRGRLSNSSIDGANFSVDIVSETLEAFNREELIWSHENQLSRTNGLDQGFEMAREIAEGKITSRFPQWRT